MGEKMKEIETKTYVFMTAISNCVTGGLIYPRNKILYLKNCGWEIVVFPTNNGPVYINGLEEYRSSKYEFLTFNPYLLSKSQINKCLDKMESKINHNGEIIIQTGTDFTSYWGELLAERLKCKHFVFFLDEYNQKINKYNAEFFKFKYDRGELNCITDSALNNIFGNYFDVTINPYPFKAYCSNCIENIESGLIKNLQDIKRDWCIGTIGRLDKNVVIEVINSVQTLATKNPDKQILLIFFGGGTKKDENRIVSALEKYSNISVYISGYIFPIPLNCIKECEVFVSAAGSANATVLVGIPTIQIDMYDNLALGFKLNGDKKKYYKINNYTTYDYLEWFFEYKNREKLSIEKKEIEQIWNSFCSEYAKQVEYVENLKNENIYFRTDNIKKTHKEIPRSIICKVMGLRFSFQIKRVYSNVKIYISNFISNKK